MNTKTREDAILGSGDGLSSVLGLIIALVIVGSPTLDIAAVSAAVGAAVSMGANEWFASSSVSRGIVMGTATFIGAFSPAIPFFFLSGMPAYVLCGIITIALGVVISRIRAGGWAISLAKTFGVIILSSGAAVGSSLIT